MGWWKSCAVSFTAKQGHLDCQVDILETKSKDPKAVGNGYIIIDFFKSISVQYSPVVQIIHEGLIYKM